MDAWMHWLYILEIASVVNIGLVEIIQPTHP